MLSGDIISNDEMKNNGMNIVTYNMVVAQKRIKIKKIKQAYLLFRATLKFEDEEEIRQRHFWIMGIDPRGYVNCVYTVLYGSHDIMSLTPIEIFQYATNRGCSRMIVAHDRREGESLNPNEEEFDRANWLYHYGRHMQVKVLDHLIINTITFLSFKKVGLLAKIKKSPIYKTCKEAFKLIDREKEKAEEKSKKEGAKNKLIEIIKNMLNKNMDLNLISDLTDICLEEIKKIEKDIHKDIVL